ncbi:MAG: hypothetical protein M5U05_13135 [Anaerolineales bacterium]|jgi:hypothetical protein|nr:hypothetical protein [Anaerolineales bacterium]
MKELISGLKTSLGVVLLVALLYVTLQFKPDLSLGLDSTGAPLPTKPTSQAYPSPPENVFPVQTETIDNPYPMPGEFVNLPPTNDCTKAGTWAEFINKEASFSFEYPAEADISEYVDNNGYPSVTLFIKPYCYIKECWGPQHVDIVVLMNPDKLSLEEFVVKQFIFDASTDPLALSRELASFSTMISVDNTSALYVNGTITREAPRVYIPHNNFVVFVGLTEHTFMPPFEPACPTILDLYNRILSSFKFLNN